MISPVSGTQSIKQAKYNQRHGNKEQTDGNQKGGGRWIVEGVRKRIKSRNMYKRPMHKDNEGRIECGSRVGMAGESNGGKWGQL